MPIEQHEGVFYELLIRGNWNPQDGALGTIKTYQLQTGTALVNTDKNELAAPFAPDKAKDLTAEEAQAYLGEKFAVFLAQLSEERAQAATEKQKLVADFETVKAGLVAEKDALKASVEAAAIENEKLRDRLSAFAEAIMAACARASA
ncbi:hypothetical protein JQ628_11325 [Bradyrhizobium lablabi]|uniref:hypothetical protein n=1 Tax=Bradyrhizobium lablabi TaxID=722472 RepID=UPI001BA796E2|nr:hypothetical protein [Bradyrhizobium lablabi]MBR1122107.1 hypothetical protein [Bradyrhizobium lablabi]